MNMPKNILDFPDEMLLHILKYVDKKDLNNLTKCCERLSRVARDKSFWFLDYREKPMIPSQIYKENFLVPLTFCLAIRGDEAKNTENVLEKQFFYNLQQICEVLKTLILEKYYIDVSEVTINNFPNTIERFEIKECIPIDLVPRATESPFYTRVSNFFHGIHFSVPNITCLIFNNVLWCITSTLLMDIGELTHLKELRITSCFRIQNFCRTTRALCSPCNFKTLEILDLRDTAVEDHLIEWFCQINSLEHLYLDCPKYLRTEFSYESVEYLQKILCDLHPYMFDEELAYCLFAAEVLCPTNVVEEVIIRMYTLFETYFLSNVSKYISRCTNLKTLFIRHYSHVTKTDIDLLALSVSNLENLDITGCSVTIEDVEHFHSQRRNVEVVSSFGKLPRRNGSY